MYIAISSISWFVRQFILPNPFEPLGERFQIALGSVQLAMSPELANIILEPILYVVTFMLVKLYYKRGEDNLAIGSFCYFVLYCVHIGMVYLMSCFDFNQTAISITTSAYILMHASILFIKARITSKVIRYY